MIGHVFASSGAVCLALAPSAYRTDEYVVLALTENGYAVADVTINAALTEPRGPSSWMRASYYDHGQNRDDNRQAAVEQFSQETGSAYPWRMVESIKTVEQFVEDRVLTVVD